MSAKDLIYNKIKGIGSNNKPISEEELLKLLRKNYNYEYPYLTEKFHDKIKIKKDDKLLKYSFNFFSILYNGVVSYIHTYISWLNLFCYEFFLDITFSEIKESQINNIIDLRETLYDKCKLKKECGQIHTKVGKKLSKLSGSSSEKIPGIINAVHLFKYMVTNVKNNKQNTTNDFCILTDHFIDYINILLTKEIHLITKR